ncbi:polysaccharide biosynthesis protein [Calditrichota bacterium LG25]
MKQRILNFLNSRGILTIFLKICIDALALTAAYFIAFSLRFDLNIPAQHFIIFKHTIGFAVVIELFFINLFGVNQSPWRYVSLQDVINLLASLFVGWVGFIIYLYFANLLAVPRSVLFLYLMLGFIFTGAARFAPRVLFKAQSRLSRDKKRVLVIGAGQAGEMIIRQMKSDPSLGFYPVALADDSPKKQNIKIHGVKVVGTVNDLQKIVSKKHIEEIIIATPAASASEMRRIVRACEATGVEFKTVPGPKEIVNGMVQVQQIREVKVEDLLDRKPVEIDLKEIKNFLANKTIMVTGAAGSIGSELVKQLLTLDSEKVICIDRSENGLFYLDNDLKKEFTTRHYKIVVADILNTNKMEYLISSYKPEIIFHAAAYKHVPLMEDHPEEAVRNNILGTAYLVKVAERLGVQKFILISTDKAVNPTSIMGATKRAAELVLQSYSAQASMKLVTVRFGNVLASYGSVIPLFQKQIADGGPITITHPLMKRFFMTIPEAVKLIFQAAKMGDGNDIFVLDMGEPIKIVEIANRLIKLSGLKPGDDIKIKYVGLRPGEKLEEELWNKDEAPLKTYHPKIYKAIGSHYNNWERMQKHLHVFEKAVIEHDIQVIKEKLHEMIPEFTSMSASVDTPIPEDILRE